MKPPKHLSADSKRVWNRIDREYNLTPDAGELLAVALANRDRAEQARELVDREGLVLDGKRHPAVDVEKQAYGLYLRALRQLGLDIEPPGPVGRPPGGI